MYVTSQQTITKPEFIWSRSFIVLWREANNVKAIKPYSKRVKLRFLATPSTVYSRCTRFPNFVAGISEAH